MKKNTVLIIVLSVFCAVMFAGVGLVSAAGMDKDMMMSNGQMMMDTGQTMVDNGKVMKSKGMKTEGTLMIRDGKMLTRHGKDMKGAAASGKMMMKEQYDPAKEFKGWQESEVGG